LFVTIATAMLLASCATLIHVDGVLVTGERQQVSESDVRAAIAALQAVLPELKAQTLTRIRVAAADEILLSYSPQRRAEATIERTITSFTTKRYITEADGHKETYDWAP